MMSVFMSDGSFRQRAKCSEAATEAARESRRLKVSLQTFDTLKQFEDTLQAQARSFYDEIPMEALPTRWTHHGAFQASSMGRSIASEPNLHPTPVLTHDNGTEKDPRRLRPPSPLHFHDYGCISLKSKSKQLQHRLKLGKPAKKVPTGHAFFVPGPHFKPGTYGDKLLDPCLMAPMCWAPPVQGCSTRRGPDVLDLRPLSTPILAAELSRQKPLGEPIPSKVRGNVASAQRARAHGEAMMKRCREDLTEQRRYENGIFLGTWRDPWLDAGGMPELATADFEWLPGALEDLLAGKSEEELGLSPPRLNAFLLLIHLDHAVRQGKTCLSKIFNAENKGPRKQLEVTQFYCGLKRIHVIKALELSEEALCEALYELDPGFDGRVYLPVLDRALKILASTGVYSRKPPHVEEEYGPLAYGETSPVRSIDIPMEADSINNFRKAFKCFRDQQNALLTFHSNLKHLGDQEHNRMSAAAADQ